MKAIQHLAFAFAIIICLQSCSSKEHAIRTLVSSIMESNGNIDSLAMSNSQNAYFEDSLFFQLSDPEFIMWVRSIGSECEMTFHWVTLTVLGKCSELYEVIVRDLHTTQWIEFRFNWEHNKWQLFSLNLRKDHDLRNSFEP